jgi:putative Mg2+ transporter-C (MgtC) family protein
VQHFARRRGNLAHHAATEAPSLPPVTHRNEPGSLRVTAATARRDRKSELELILDQLIADFTLKTVTPYPVMIARACGALILVAIIGAEREAKASAAGLRTHMLVGLAAAIFAILAIEVPNAAYLGDTNVQTDPLRIVEAVTSGVAFLAAGLIVFSKGEVHGLTTGAGVWLAASIGVAVGFGYWGLGLAAAVLGAIVLRLLYRLKLWLNPE